MKMTVMTIVMISAKKEKKKNAQIHPVSLRN